MNAVIQDHRVCQVYLVRKETVDSTDDQVYPVKKVIVVILDHQESVVSQDSQEPKVGDQGFAVQLCIAD